MSLKPKRRLSPKKYKELCNQVLDRDKWKCIICGSRNNLTVHHIQYRSQLGVDALDNLCTVCNDDHTKIHQGKIVL